MMECKRKQIRTRLAGGIRTVRMERSRLSELARRAKRPVDLIGRHVKKPFNAGSLALQQNIRPKHVGRRKDAAPKMLLSTWDSAAKWTTVSIECFLKVVSDFGPVTNITTQKPVARILPQHLQRFSRFPAYVSLSKLNTFTPG